MKRLLLVLVVLLIFLDFLALDDITTGNEPDLSNEHLMLTISGIVFVGLILLLDKKFLK